MKLLHGLVGLSAMSLLFMSTEYSYTFRHFHHPRYEFAFWVLVVYVFNTLMLFAEDAPIQLSILDGKPLYIGLFGVANLIFSASTVETFMVQGLQQFRAFDQHRKAVLLREGSETPAQSQTKLKKVNKLLDRLVFTSQLRMFTAWIRGVLNERKKAVNELLAVASKEDLNHIISSINVPQLLTYANYTRGSKTESINTLEMILKEREKDLSIVARASLLHGLMRIQTVMFQNEQLQWVERFLLGATGSDLTLLKNLLDSSGDYNNLFKLVYVDISDEKVRKKVLKHIKIQAKETIRMNQQAGHRSVKVLSDIDDTLFSSGGVFPAGADDRIPRHEVYPGVLTLFEEIDVAARRSGTALSRSKIKAIQRLSKSRRASGVESVYDEDEDEVERELKQLFKQEDEMSLVESQEVVQVVVELPSGGLGSLSFTPTASIEEIQQEIETKYLVPPWNQRITMKTTDVVNQEHSHAHWDHGNVVFVSARPHAYRDITENGSYRKFHRMINAGRMHATPTLLAGNLSSGLAAVFIRSFDEVVAFVRDAFEAAVELTKFTAYAIRGKEYIAEDEEEGQTLRKIFTNIGSTTTTNRNWTSTGVSKAERFNKYADLYPEYRFVFFGDDGQGDLLAAEMISEGNNKNRIIRSFIHQVVPEHRLHRLLTRAKSADDRSERWKKSGIVLFKTYVGASVEAFNVGLIPIRGLHRVVQTAKLEMERMIEEYPEWDFRIYVENINADFEKANQVLKEHDAPFPQVQLVDFL